MCHVDLLLNISKYKLQPVYALLSLSFAECIKQNTAKQDGLERILLELSSTAKSFRPTGCMGTVTCGLKPPLWF